MKFAELEAEIPYDMYGDRHTDSRILSANVRVLQPGKYQDITDGGDFVVEYTGPLNGKQVVTRRVTYQDMFKHWCALDAAARQAQLDALQAGSTVDAFTEAVYALTVAEYRRYKKYERCTTKPWGFAPNGSKPMHGGRWLLLNYLTVLHVKPELLDTACAVVKSGSNGLKVLETLL